MKEPFKLEEIEDVRIIIKARGKNWALTPNKENAEKEDVDPRALRIAILGAILKLHDIVTPALEDIKSERASADTSHESSGLNIADVSNRRELLLAFCDHLNEYPGMEEVRFDFMMQDYLDKSQ